MYTLNEINENEALRKSLGIIGQIGFECSIYSEYHVKKGGLDSNLIYMSLSHPIDENKNSIAQAPYKENYLQKNIFGKLSFTTTSNDNTPQEKTLQTKRPISLLVTEKGLLWPKENFSLTFEFSKK